VPCRLFENQIVDLGSINDGYLFHGTFAIENSSFEKLNLELLSEGGQPVVLSFGGPESENFGKLYVDRNVDKVKCFIEIAEHETTARPDCYINGIKIVSKAQLELATPNGKLFCLEMPIPKEYVSRTRHLVEVHIGESRFVGLATKLNFPRLAKSAMLFPLRVTGIVEKNEKVGIFLYNESNKEKADILIEEVHLDGKNVTDQCEMPKKPLRADRHEVIRDTQVLEIPSKLFMTTDVKVRLDFRQLEARYPSSKLNPNSNFSTSFIVRKGVCLPIGGPGYPDVDEAICVSNATLRPMANQSDVFSMISEIRHSDSSIPIYITGHDAAKNLSQFQLGNFVDFVTLSLGGAVRKGNDIFEVREFLDDLRHAIPQKQFVVELSNGERGISLDPENHEWLALTGLSYCTSYA
jgi:hypothetical protein